jgi:hypothetical protein
VSTESELLQIAREHERRSDAIWGEMDSIEPNLLQKQLRAYLIRQTDHNRMKHRVSEKIPTLKPIGDNKYELACPKITFVSDAQLEFKIEVEKQQTCWLMRQLKFHIFLAPETSINMLRIHLKPTISHDPTEIPRCHMHIGDNRAHIPFPAMDPRLILHFICEHIIPGFNKGSEV